jgi:2-oxoglutarate dehydrogenase E2 component (dihydrolipoamide succinyltransferase)
MATEVRLPQLGESVHEGTVSKWLKKVGDTVGLYEPLVEITTDKVDTEMPSPVAGVLLQILVPEGATVKTGTPIALVGEVGSDVVRESAEGGTGEPTRAPGAEAPAASPANARSGLPSAPRLSPVVARMVAEHNIDISQLKGSGEGGRITKQDILAYLESRKATPPAAAPTAAPGVQEEVIPLTVMRRTIAERMIQSKRTSAHVTAVIEVDMTRVVQLREKHKEEFLHREGVRLTYLAFIAHAAIRAIKDYPIVNAVMAEDTIIIKHYVNLGIAVALEDGLIVPVIKRADEKSLLGLARAIEDLAQRAREKRLTVDDVQGGTFTITNPGVFGTILGTPIIHQPQVAILDVEAIVKRPVVVSDERGDAIAIRSMMNLSLSFDHRVFDGAQAAMFLARVKAYLEGADFGLTGGQLWGDGGGEGEAKRS